MNIKQAQELVGTTIPRIEVKVCGITDRKTGEGQYGPWSLQPGTIEDSSGKMKVLFKQLPCQAKLAGRTIVLKSMEGKHGLKGVEVKKGKEYKGKSEVELHVSNVALIVGGEEENNVALAQPSTRMPQNEPQMPLEASLGHEDRKMGIGIAKNRLTQMAGLYDLCWKTVEVMENTLGNLSAELHKDIATTLFIQACRENLADKMPVRTTSKFYNEDAKEAPSATHRGEPASFDGDSGSNEDYDSKPEQPF